MVRHTPSIAPTFGCEWLLPVFFLSRLSPANTHRGCAVSCLPHRRDLLAVLQPAGGEGVALAPVECVFALAEAAKLSRNNELELFDLGGRQTNDVVNEARR